MLPVVVYGCLCAKLGNEHILCVAVAKNGSLDSIRIGRGYGDVTAVVHSDSKFKRYYLICDSGIGEYLIDKSSIIHKTAKCAFCYKALDIACGEYLSEVVLVDDTAFDESVDNRLLKEEGLDLINGNERLTDSLILDESIELVVVSCACDIVFESSNSGGVEHNSVNNGAACRESGDGRTVGRIHNGADLFCINECYELRLYGRISHKVVNESCVIDNVLNEFVGENLALEVVVESKLDHFVCEKHIKLVYVNSGKDLLDGNEINDLLDSKHVEKHVEREVLSYHAYGKNVNQRLEVINRHIVCRESYKIVAGYFPSFRKCFEDVCGNKLQKLLSRKISVLKYSVDLIGVDSDGDNSVFVCHRVIIVILSRRVRCRNCECRCAEAGRCQHHYSHNYDKDS